MPPINAKTFPAETRGAKKIAVVDLGFLGDTVHLVPALWEIKDHFPGAQLHVVTSPLGTEVLKLAPCVDRAWVYPLGPPSPPWWKHWNLLFALRREHFDVAFNLNGMSRALITTALLNGRNAAVRWGPRHYWWHRLFSRNWIADEMPALPVYERRRHFLKLCGFDSKPARFDLNVPGEDRDWARANIPAGSVHLSLNASSSAKEWPREANVKFLRELFASGLDRKVVMTIGNNPRERERLEYVCREISDDRLLPVNERLSISRLAAVLEQCALHVGPDSGVVHLAWALNLPTVSFFRRDPGMKYWVPPAPKHAHFEADCPCLAARKPVCHQSNGAACLGRIAPELVARDVLGRLNGCNKS